MPNWCTTDITINCNSKKQAEGLYNLLDEWIETPCIENGFGTTWLGNIIERSGLDHYDLANHKFPKGYFPRGSVAWLDWQDEQVLLTTETAWTPKLRLFADLIDKYASDAELIYTATECGCELYYTNDPYVEGNYFVDCYEPTEGFKEGTYDTFSEEQLRKMLNGRSIDDVSDGVSIHQYQYAEVSEWWE